MSNETSVKTEYKETLNLPQTTLAMRANATVRELEIQKFWEEHDIYNKIIILKIRMENRKYIKYPRHCRRKPRQMALNHSSIVFLFWILILQQPYL